MIIISTGWNYSDLSREAKLNGGPDKYIAAIFKDGFIKGTISGSGAMCVLIGGYIGGKYLLKKHRYFKENKEILNEEIDNKTLEEIEKPIKDGFNEYQESDF